MHTAYLLLGSNQGDRHEWLRCALEDIEKNAGHLSRCSGIYETAAWGLESQPAFLNQAVCLHTRMGPDTLLDTLQHTEQLLGRQRSQKWGQRTLDIDIAFYDGLIINTERLSIPHPFLAARRFMLAPLAEIAPDFEHPLTGETISSMLASCGDPLPVRRLERFAGQQG